MIPHETGTFIKINQNGLQIRLNAGPAREDPRAILGSDWVRKEIALLQNIPVLSPPFFKTDHFLDIGQRDIHEVDDV